MSLPFEGLRIEMRKMPKILASAVGSCITGSQRDAHDPVRATSKTYATKERLGHVLKVRRGEARDRVEFGARELLEQEAIICQRSSARCHVLESDQAEAPLVLRKSTRDLPPLESYISQRARL